MKHSLYLLFAINILFCTVANSQVLYSSQDSCFIEKALTKKYCNENLIVEMARIFIGIPYKGGTLDCGNNEQLTVNTRELDCTTFVETVTALAVTYKEGKVDFISFCNNLRKIRYRNGVCTGYADRLHYISQWITDKGKGNMIKEITTPAHSATQRVELNYMSSHPDCYRQLKENKELIKEIRKYETPFNGVDIKYIPKNLLNDKHAVGDIRNGDIIAIVTNIEGLDVSHMGFAIWKNGKLHLLHASSNAEEVIEDRQTLYDYMSRKRKHLGIRVFRINK